MQTPLGRTTGYGSAEDLDLAALANRVWDEPFFGSGYPVGASPEEIERAREEVWWK